VTVGCEFVNQLANQPSVKGAEDEGAIHGVMAVTVVNNVDLLGMGRVQIQIPGQAVMPWARVATPMAGLMRGVFFMPQVGDEVLVAFSRGDLTAPFIIGGLWNGVDRPPSLAPTDAVTKRVIRTPLGHQIEFDEALQTVTITSSTQQKITLDPTKVELSAGLGAASVTVETAGRVVISAAAQVEISAPVLTLQGTKVEVKGDADVTVDGGLHCGIKATLVEIN
jgi:phage baseplate assembly protein V